MTSSAQSKKPRVLLFDIGGVCVLSPMQAIKDYEIAHDIPAGYINHSISASGPSGSWARLERGEILMDAAFFAEFKQDLSNEQRWHSYYKQNRPDRTPIPPLPDIEAEGLFYKLHSQARTPDPHMYPALKRLRQLADQTRDTTGDLVLAALSNTSIFPPDHDTNDTNSEAMRGVTGVKGVFDIFVSSAHVGMRKPDPEIYRYALTRIHEYCKTRYQAHNDPGVQPADFVFLDDIGTNLRTARQLGMKTIKVQLGRADLAVNELERIMGVSLSKEGEDKSRL